jgi:hypothetical protein
MAEGEIHSRIVLSCNRARFNACGLGYQTFLNYNLLFTTKKLALVALRINRVQYIPLPY